MRLLTLALLLPLFGCAPATITELGTVPGGLRSAAEDINDAGLVVGWVQTGERAIRAVTWRGGSITELALPATAHNVQSANGVNADEQVVGRMGTTESSAHAFLWRRGTTTDLGAGREESYAWGVGPSGHVVGERSLGPVTQAIVWVRGTGRDLVTVAGTHSIAFAVEKHGQAVGRSTVAEGPAAPYQAVLWADGVVLDLGTLGGRNSVAYDIRVGRWPDAGYETTYVVGEAQTPEGDEHAFVWNRGSMRDLGVLPGDIISKATSINAGRVIVGYSRSRAGDNRACMWIDGVIVDLNTRLPPDSGWVLETATAINNRRQIVGAGNYRGQSRGFLLTLSS